MTASPVSSKLKVHTREDPPIRLAIAVGGHGILRFDEQVQNPVFALEHLADPEADGDGIVIGLEVVGHHAG